MKTKTTKTCNVWRIFEGAHGYYVAWVDDAGFHRQPEDCGARIGWDKATAKRKLRECQEAEETGDSR